jgi:fibronectin-binding autotransporter adhesin
MVRRAKFVVRTGLSASLSLILPVSLRGGTLYTYSGGLVNLNFTTSLTGAALDDLPAGTDITSTLGSSLTITAGKPAADNGGFASADWALSDYDFKIGTGATGGVSSWDITGLYFVSFPAVPGENPNDFFGTYNLTLTTAGDSATLITDNDAGFAPTSASSGPGTWSPAASGIHSTWTGGNNDGNWSEAGNWNSGAPVNLGDTATFGPSSATPTTVNVNSNFTVGVLTLNSASATYTLAPTPGGSITLDNGVNLAEIDDLSGNHVISAPVSIASAGVTIAVGRSQDTLTISGSISGTGGIALNPTSTSQSLGTTLLSGTNSYIGNTNVDAGTLQLAGDTLASGTVGIGPGGVLNYSDSANTYQNPTTYVGAGTLRKTGSGNLIFGAFGDVNVNLSPGGLVDVEAGTLTGSSSYGGIWTSNQASLNVAGGATFNAVEAGGSNTMQIDALTGSGTFLGGYYANANGGLIAVTLGVAGGSGTFSGSLQNNPSSRLGILKAGGGTETFTGTNSYSGGTTVNAGTLVIGANGGLPTDSTVSITGGTLKLGASTGVTQISSLSITGNGTFDVNNDRLIINYGSGPDPTASIAALLKSGYAGGAWKGAGGIVSTAAAANSGSYGLAYGDAADPGNPAALSSGTIEISYTLKGDINQDGVVNGTDFSILAGNFGKNVTGGWEQGDLNYDGVVNGTDFGLLAGNFGKSATGRAIVLPEADWSALDSFAAAHGLLADVPEPATGSLLVLLSSGALLPRRRRREIAIFLRSVGNGEATLNRWAK